MPKSNEVWIDFTTEELLVLAELLEFDAPPGAGADGLHELAVAGNDELMRQAAVRSLEARKVLMDGQVVDPISEVMSVLCNPGLLVAASVEQDGVVDTRFLGVMPEIAVEHQGLSVSLHRLTPFASRDLMSRILQFSNLRPYVADSEVSFVVDEEVLDRAAGALDDNDHVGAEKLLSDSGIAESDARTFVYALTMKHSSASIAVLHRPEDDRVEGGALTWIDAGIAGLWLTELAGETGQLESASEKLEIRRVNARDLAAELLSYLPDAFAEHGVVF